MKGLLVKDLCLIFQRKRSFVILLIVGFLMSFSVEPGFFVGWMVLCGSLFAVGTIAYDEHDNGYPFLMTLPVSRRCCVVEKYVFGAICAAAFWAAGVIFYVASALIRGGSMNIAEECITLFILLLLPFLIMDFCIPFELKYGAEKGRLYMIIAWGIVFAAVFIINQYAGNGTLEISADAEQVSDMAIAGIVLAVTVIATVISVSCSMRTMIKKEF